MFPQLSEKESQGDSQEQALKKKETVWPGKAHWKLGFNEGFMHMLEKTNVINQHNVSSQEVILIR